jgi:hypothetical protein
MLNMGVNKRGSWDIGYWLRGDFPQYTQGGASVECLADCADCATRSGGRRPLDGDLRLVTIHYSNTLMTDALNSFLVAAAE